mmetsp:Transcript_1494/g.2702  ORF Transcript_1494/g.2702 Transcript_1494/m.2702 type:complete len:402 (-) Transcript_1494:331-1536(-)
MPPRTPFILSLVTAFPSNIARTAFSPSSACRSLTASAASFSLSFGSSPNPVDSDARRSDQRPGTSLIHVLRRFFAILKLPTTSALRGTRRRGAFRQARETNLGLSIAVPCRVVGVELSASAALPIAAEAAATAAAVASSGWESATDVMTSASVPASLDRAASKPATPSHTPSSSLAASLTSLASGTAFLSVFPFLGGLNLPCSLMARKASFTAALSLFMSLMTSTTSSFGQDKKSASSDHSPWKVSFQPSSISGHSFILSRNSAALCPSSPPPYTPSTSPSLSPPKAPTASSPTAPPSLLTPLAHLRSHHVMLSTALVKLPSFRESSAPLPSLLRTSLATPTWSERRLLSSLNRPRLYRCGMRKCPAVKTCSCFTSMPFHRPRIYSAAPSPPRILMAFKTT